MSDIDPFSQENLDRIFKISAKHPDRLSSRESKNLEFKESFGFRAMVNHLRTLAGFANAKGGHIIYGVGPSPRTLIGMQTEDFQSLDPEMLTKLLSEYFDPEIQWNAYTHELLGKSFGLIYVHESKNKPVICRKQYGDAKYLKEGEIYYRYQGKTQVIRYPELKQLIDERRQTEQNKWIELLKEIARIGVADAALLDLRRGNISGPGGTIVIDESLIPQLAFIREGEFSEIKGTPTLKLIGNVQSMQATDIGGIGQTTVIKTPGIRASDIMRAFLKTTKVKKPDTFFTQIAWESSAYLPCYYFLSLSKKSIAQGLELIQKEESSINTKERLIARLQHDTALQQSLPSEKNHNGRRKLALRRRLIEKEISDVSEVELADLLDMIRTLDRSEAAKLTSGYLKQLLLSVLNKYYAKQDTSINDKIRRAICYIDWLYYAKEVSS